MDLVLDIGNYQIKGAFFERNKPTEFFKITSSAAEDVQTFLEGRAIGIIFISSVNEPIYAKVLRILRDRTLSHRLLDIHAMKLQLHVDEPDQVGHDRIANCYGALCHFPQNECVIVDLGTAITFDYTTSSGQYLGGAILPGMSIAAKALAEYTSLLPEVAIAKPKQVVAKTTKTHIQSGLYYGLLGAIERITFEMAQTHATPSDVKILATGGIFSEPLGENLKQDLGDFVDLIDPNLTLIGLYELMKENG